MPSYQVKLAGREPLAEGTLALRFEKPAGFAFKPGQAVVLELVDPPPGEGQKRRTFSLVSAPFERTLTIATRMRDTAFKRALNALPEGASVKLLGPLGAIPDAGERKVLFMDLVDDLLAPLGSVVTPAGLRAGKSIGSVVVHARDGISELELTPGGLELVDLPPRSTAVAEFKFRDRVRLGGRGRHFAIDVAGGLGGLMVDLRDVPLKLPDRADRRRDLLAAWQSSMWAGAEG